MPNTKVMEEKAGPLMKEFNSLIFPDDYDTKGGKRKVCIMGNTFADFLAQGWLILKLLTP